MQLKDFCYENVLKKGILECIINTFVNCFRRRPLDHPDVNFCHLSLTQGQKHKALSEAQVHK